MHLRLSPIAVASLLLVGCPRSAQQPIALASAPAHANLGTAVQLDGSQSTDPQNRQISFSWSLVKIPPGSRASLNDAHAANPSFIADVAGVFEAKLVVSNSFLSSEQFTVDVTVDDCGTGAPVVGAVTATPQGAAAGVSAKPGQTVTLAAPVSDADSACTVPFSETFLYTFALRSRPQGSAAFISNPNGALSSAAAVASALLVPDLPGAYQAEVVITDSTGRSSIPAVVNFIANNCGFNAPEVGFLAGGSVAGTVLVQGTPASSLSLPFPVVTDADASCGSSESFTYAWKLVSRPANSSALLANPTLAAPSFTPDHGGDYQFSVTVTDSTFLTSAPAFVNLQVNACDQIVPVVAISPGSGIVGTQITLTSSSFDANCLNTAGTLFYSWTLKGPPASAALLDNPGAASPKFTPDVPGVYLASLSVKNPQGFSSNLATQTLTINACLSNPHIQIATDLPPPSGQGSINLTATSPSGAMNPNVDPAANPINSVSQLPDRGDRVVLSLPASNLHAGTCGTAPNGSFTYQWGLIGRPPGSSAALSSTTDAQPFFAPDTPNGVYIVQLTVRDSIGNLSNTVTQPITTSSCGGRFPAAPTFCIPNGAPDTFQSETLSAAGVADPEIGCDARFSNSSYTYKWSTASGATLTASSVAPGTSTTSQFGSTSPGSYTVSLVVVGSDGLASSPSTSTGNVGACTNASNPVVVSPCGAYPPQALDVTVGATPTTPAFVATQSSGSASVLTHSDLLPADGVTFSTNFPLQIKANVIDLDTASPTNTTYTLPGTSTSIAACGRGGSQSISVQWSFASVPTGSTALLKGSTTPGPSFTPDVAGAYTLQLISTDSTGQSKTQTFTVTADSCGASPPSIGTLSAKQVTPNNTICSGTGVGCTVLNSTLFDVGFAVAADGGVTDTQAGCTRTSGGSAFSQTQTFAWSFASVPAGSLAILSNANTAAPSFTPDVAGPYVLALTVTDQSGLSVSKVFAAINAPCGSAPPVAADTATDGAVEARQTVPSVVNTGPLAIIQSSSKTQPTAAAFPGGINNGQALYQQVPVQLVVASVVEIDTTVGCAAVAPPLPAISYNWSFSKLPLGSRALFNSTAAQNPSFTPDVNGEYDVALKLTDAFGRSSTTTYFFVQAGVCGGQGPVAAISFSQSGVAIPSSLSLGVPVLLDGTSPDPDKTPRTAIDTGNGANGCGLPLTLSYSWAFTSVPAGATPTLSNANIVNPAFTPVQFGSYGLSLLVSDGRSTSRANVTLTVDKQWIAKNNAGAPSTSTLTVNRLRVDSTSSHLWAGTNLGIWESLNGGTSWVQSLSAGNSNNWTGLSIAYRTSGVPLVFAVENSCGANFQRFDGTSWAGVNAPTCAPDALAADPTDPTGNTVVMGNSAASAPGVMVTTSAAGLMSFGGVQNNGLGTDTSILAVAVAANGAVLVGTDGTGASGGRIYRLPSVATVLANGTNPWVKVLDLNPASTAGGSITALYADAATGAVLASVGDGRVYQSLDYGLSWALRLAAGPAAAKDVYLDTLGNGFAAVGQSLFLSRNNGATWASISSGLPAAIIDSVAFDPARPGAGYAGTAGLGFFGTLTYGP